MLQNLDHRITATGPSQAGATPHRPVTTDPELAADLTAILAGVAEIAVLLQVATERETDPIRMARAVLAKATCDDLRHRLEDAARVLSADVLLTLLAEMNDLCAEVAAIGLLPRD